VLFGSRWSDYWQERAELSRTWRCHPAVAVTKKCQLERRKREVIWVRRSLGSVKPQAFRLWGSMDQGKQIPRCQRPSWPKYVGLGQLAWQARRGRGPGLHGFHPNHAIVPSAISVFACNGLSSRPFHDFRGAMKP